MLRRLALASVVANVAIVVTGGAVRLTDSGLGCPTWPRCTDASYTATSEMGVHGVIEFGNRLLTFVVAAVAVAGVVAAWRHRGRLRWLSVAIFLGIPAQGVIGGFTVLTDLNPWVVGLHFLASIAVIAVAYAFWRATGPPASVRAPSSLRPLGWVLAVASAAVLVVGTWVTGSGPHSGDHGAARNGLDPETISQVHADLVFLLIGLTVAAWLALRATGQRVAARAAMVLLAVELGQGLIGFVQYFTDLPVVLVGAHMLGACLVWLATLSVVWSLHTSHPPADASPEAPAAVAAPAPAPAPAEPTAAPASPGRSAEASASPGRSAEAPAAYAAPGRSGEASAVPGSLG